MSEPREIAARLTEATVFVQVNRNTLAQLITSLRECAEDLEAYVNAEYTLEMREHPAMDRRYVRDMGAVIRARQVLAELDKEPRA